MTALDYANANENVVIRYTSQGSPAGCDVAWIPGETDLPFSLDEIEGEANEEGFTATNLERGRGWAFRDWRGNSIYGLWLRVDSEVWEEKYAEFMGE